MNKMKDFLIFIAIGVLMSIMFSSGQVENPDTHLRLAQTKIIIENGSLRLLPDVGENSHGNIAINKFGERCMVYNPGQSLVFIPFYLISKEFTKNSADSYYLTTFFISFINYIINAISGFFLFKIIIGLGYSRKKALVSAFVFCFTSYSFVFAQSTYEHHFEMLFVLISLYLSLASNIKYNYIYAGLVISIGLIFRSTTVLLIPSICILLSTNRERFLFLLSTIPGVFILLIYNYYRFDNPLETGYSLAWTLAHGKEMIFWSIAGIPKAFFGLLISPGKGLLFFSPTILIAIFYSKKFYLKNRKFTNSILLFILLYLLLFSMNFIWGGSIWSFGPRYILPLVPFFYIPIAELKVNRLVFPILLFAFIFQLLLISVNYKRAVLEQYVIHDGIDEENYIFNLSNIPIITQSRQLYILLTTGNQKDLINYQPNTHWKKEIRLGTNKDVLKNSIEKNSINFWWIRIFHWNTSVSTKVITILIIIITFIFSFKTYFYVKKNI